MQQSGRVKFFRKNEGKKGYGYIVPDLPIPDYDKGNCSQQKAGLVENR
jgi:hypothetical protein